MNRKSLFLTAALISGFAGASVSSTAYAGFEWNPPPAKTQPAKSQNAADAQGGPLTPMPGDTSATARVEPVTASDIMDDGNAMPPVTQTRMPGMKSIGQNAPAGKGSESDLMLPVPGEMQAANPAKTVEGFGRDIPLAVALQQVVPLGYNVAYDSGVDSGKPVSWKGGKAWDQVVSDMLRNKKLHAELSGNAIKIVKGAGADLAIPATPAMANNDAPMVDDGPAPSPKSAMNSGRPVIDMNLHKHWSAPAGRTLKDTLSDWSGQANVELAWQTMNDQPLKSAFSFDGSYDQAVDALLSLYGGGNSEPRGKLYPNLPDGPSVLVIGSN